MTDEGYYEGILTFQGPQAAPSAFRGKAEQIDIYRSLLILYGVSIIVLVIHSIQNSPGQF